jgi:hypothetical protein
MSNIVLLKIDWTSGIQPPHPVPALVQDLTSAMDLQVPFFTLSATSPLVTLWQEQICVLSSLLVKVSVDLHIPVLPVILTDHLHFPHHRSGHQG